MDLLLTASATELAKRIRRREVSSQEVVAAHIRRAREVNPTLNAIVHDRFDAALADAERADEEVKRNPDGVGPSTVSPAPSRSA
jgi:fatty acid amide hydrolase 2